MSCEQVKFYDEENNLCCVETFGRYPPEKDSF